MSTAPIRSLALLACMASLACSAGAQCRISTPSIPAAGNESECRAALDAAVRTGDRDREADAVARLRDLSLAKGNPAEAIRHSTRYVALLENAKDRMALAHALSEHGALLGGVGQVQDGRNADERALAIYRSLGAMNHPLASAASQRQASGTAPARKRNPGQRSDDNG